MKSRGDGRAAAPLSVRGAVVVRLALPAPPAVAEDAAAGRPIEAAPVDAPGAGADADAGMLTGCFAQPLTTRISSAVGIINFALID
jgi:hypothetical protein